MTGRHPAGQVHPLMNHRRLSALFAALFVLATLRAAAPDVPLLAPAEIGHLHRPITTKSPEAQRYFDQGLALLFSFDHDNSIRSFQAAARLDPECAMAWWGVALASGPHINFPMVPPDRVALASAALGQAARHSAGTTPAEQALIAAQARRFADPQPADRKPLDAAYANAMREAWEKFPGDADIGALFAEAMMNLRPWDLWQADGAPQPGTAEIVATLAAVRKIAPRHPFALHLTIHALEASPAPAHAADAADQLRDLQPALGHMVHMPSHIDVLLGRWEEAVVANARAVEADRRTRERFGAPRGFLWLYFGHNRHMLAFAAMMTGRSELALSHMNGAPGRTAGRRGVAGQLGLYARLFRPDEDGSAGALRPVGGDPRHARVRRPAVRSRAPCGMPRAPSHSPPRLSRPAARAEQRAFAAARGKVPAEAFFGNNAASTILDVAEAMLDGEILLREGRDEEGLARLREAVASRGPGPL